MQRGYPVLILALLVAFGGVVWLGYRAGTSVSDEPAPQAEAERPLISAVVPRPEEPEETSSTSGEPPDSADAALTTGTTPSGPAASDSAEAPTAARTIGEAPQSAAPSAGAAVDAASAPGASAQRIAGAVSAAGVGDQLDAGALETLGALQPATSATPRPINGAPVFDTVRIDPDGSAVLAGRAAPGAIVDVTIDGKVAETVTADSRGEFVALIAAPNDPDASRVRRLDLAVRSPENEVIATSEAPVIITAPEKQDESPVALRPGPLGVDLLQRPKKVQGLSASIDKVSYSEEGAVRVAGRGAPGEIARIYLDNALEAEAQVSDEGVWDVELQRDIEPARYTLRVDVTAQGGDVIGRAETPFERASTDDIKLQKGAVIVQPGNNLWKIADHVYGDGRRYTIIYRSNQDQIRDPDLIYPGQIFNLPSDADADASDAASALPTADTAPSGGSDAGATTEAASGSQ